MKRKAFRERDGKLSRAVKKQLKKKIREGRGDVQKKVRREQTQEGKPNTISILEEEVDDCSYVRA